MESLELASWLPIVRRGECIVRRGECIAAGVDEFGV